ncbi:MAG: GNAT family N-acetyltransferase [Candidatus Dormiibacterota bacterium]
MVSNLSPAAVDTKTAPRDFWERYHAYRRLRQAETRPEDPVKPDDLVEKEMKHDEPFDIRYRYALVRDGVLVSWFTASTAKPGTPGYESNRHILWADASVHKDHRRHGIGRSWIPLAVELMDRHGCTTLSMGTEEMPGHAFFKWMGADARFGGAENRLALRSADWPMLRRWAEDGPRKSPTTKLEIYDGHLPEQMWDDYCPQFSTMLNTMPWEQLDHGDIVVTPAHMKDWTERLDEQGAKEHTMLTRELNGVISGITDMSYAPSWKPGTIHQGFTGVRSDARGRGLGKWLKAAMLLHVHELYPQVEVVSTENAGSNAPMLGINKKMGFKEYRAGSEYQITRDELIARSSST